MYLYVYIYVYVYENIHVCVYIYAYMCICTHMHIHICTYVWYAYIPHILYVIYTYLWSKQNFTISPDVMQVFYAYLYIFMLSNIHIFLYFTCITSGEIMKFWTSNKVVHIVRTLYVKSTKKYIIYRLCGEPELCSATEPK